MAMNPLTLIANKLDQLITLMRTQSLNTDNKESIAKSETVTPEKQSERIERSVARSQASTGNGGFGFNKKAQQALGFAGSVAADLTDPFKPTSIASFEAGQSLVNAAGSIPLVGPFAQAAANASGFTEAYFKEKATFNDTRSMAIGLGREGIRISPEYASAYAGMARSVNEVIAANMKVAAEAFDKSGAGSSGPGGKQAFDITPASIKAFAEAVGAAVDNSPGAIAKRTAADVRAGIMSLAGGGGQ